MTIKNSVASAGLEASGVLSVKNGVALSGTVQQTTSFTAISPTIGRLKVRIRVYSGGGTSPTLADIVVQVKDGTNTVTVYVVHPNVAVALSTTASADFTSEILIFEIAANEVDILTTLGGTSPTASMDVEIFATP